MTLKKNCKIFRIVFLHHRVEVSGPTKNRYIKSGEKPWVAHPCSYTLVKFVLGGLVGKAPRLQYTFFKILAGFILSRLYPWF